MLGLILITLVVLVRRVNNAEDEEWVEDAFEEEEEANDEESTSFHEATEGPANDPASEPGLSDEVKASLATKAAEVGVMQAAPGTEQGQSGWYVDVSTEVQYWDVGDDGSWTQVS